MLDVLTTYPGGKNAGGAYQNIINLIPPHSIYVELFLGSGAVWRHKKPASRSYVVEKDCGILQQAKAADVENTDYLSGDAVEFICHRAKIISSALASAETFIYADPPYLPETRTSGAMYKHELTEADHVRLLDGLLSLSCSVAISGYPSALYESKLKGWRTFEYQAMTRGGTMRTEIVWMNYPKPSRLHDYKFLGKDRTDRQRIKRKIHRWKTKLSTLDLYERAALLEELTTEKI